MSTSSEGRFTMTSDGRLPTAGGAVAGAGLASQRRAREGHGRAAVEQARLILLLMINVAQLWILSATVEAGLAHHLSLLLPLVVASLVCFLITLTVLLWWRPVSRRPTSTGYIREARR